MKEKTKIRGRVRDENISFKIFLWKFKRQKDTVALWDISREAKKKNYFIFFKIE